VVEILDFRDLDKNWTFFKGFDVFMGRCYIPHERFRNQMFMKLKTAAIFRKTIVNLATMVLKAKKVFHAPKKAKILVIDGVRLEVLRPLFNGETFEVFYVRGESINLNPTIMMKTLIYLIKGNEKSSYAKAFIDQVQPCIIITFVDNNLLFRKLDAENKDSRVKFITIQNGYRVFTGIKEIVAVNGGDPEAIYHSNFFCFGQYDMDQYREGGANVENFYPCGSLIDSYSRAMAYRNKSNVDSSVICLISDCSNMDAYESIWGHLRLSYELLLTYLKKFSERNNIAITVACKKHSGTDDLKHEIEWLQQHLGGRANYVPNNAKNWMSYSLTDTADVVVGGITTLLREIFGRGKKVLSCNYSGDSTMEFPVDGICLLKQKGYQIFEDRLLELISMDVDNYKKRCHKPPSYLMGYSETKPVHLFIAEIIREHIAAVNTLPIK